jgi:hypothetical protein
LKLSGKLRTGKKGNASLRHTMSTKRGPEREKEREYERYKTEIYRNNREDGQKVK